MAEPMGDDVIHVAVNKDVRESKSTLLWALRNLNTKKVCILHVHRPNRASPVELEAIMFETLHDYFELCKQEGLNEDDIYVSCIEMDDVRQGIMELIHENKFKKLVMGAAADRHYSETMCDLKSRKAKYVCQHAPASCEVLFTCKGHLIYTKEAKFEDVDDSESKPKLSAMVAYNEGDRNCEIYRQLKQALVEVEESKREAFEECVRRYKAEKTAVDAIRKARELEEALTKQKKVNEKTKQERDDALVIILNGRKLYNEELRRRVEAEEMLAKEKEEHERSRKEMEEVRLILQDGMQLYNEQLRQKKEMEECMKRREEEVEKMRKEKEEACLISKNLMQLYEEEARQRKEMEELMKRRRDDLEKVKKEKDEACSVGQNFMRLYEEEARRRKAAEEELAKATTQTHAAKSVCTDILVLLHNYSRRHGGLIRVTAAAEEAEAEEEAISHQPPSYFICPISQEVMREPHVAADGFTYEAEALREWLNSGRETSPMTNLKLMHNNLVPNHALRSAIQEWLQRNS